MRQTATQALRRWAFALLAVALLAGGGAAAYTLLTPSQYSASTQLLVGPVNEDAEGIKASSQLIGTYAQLVVSGTALSNAANQVGGGLTGADVQAATAIQFSSATRILDISVTLNDPQAALKVVSSLKDQLLARTAQQSGPGSLSVVVDPQTSGLPIDRQPYLRGVVAGFTALLLGLLLVILLEQTRGVIRTFADVEAATGREPLVEFPRRSKGGSARHNDAPTNAAYRMLAAYLDTLPPGAGAHCVAVVGTGADGRSQMPLNLAITLAATGRRALLLENESEKARNLAVFDTAPIDITGQTALYLFAPDPTGNDFSVQRLGFTPETYQLAGAWAGSRSRGATEDAVAAAGAVADWIVLAPRAIQSSDVGLAWASAADAVLLVVEQGVTRRTELQAALVTLRRITNQPVEVVLAPQGVRDGQDTKASLRAIAAEAKAKADRRKGRGDAAAVAAASFEAAIEPPAARPALQQQAPGHGSGQDWPAPAGPAS
ncbi:Wzz/FepE/Etk N-terminal domain-containing protein, partial [Kineosporia sp. A_224]|uniref:Wzz/FepE/Etk N-terminal domain-containing protein n=1 Tax=Kineosporia sp. A_224 TaxID=1962180 RepID=UPI00350FF900